MTIEQHNGIDVLRDDLLPGGTKSTFLDKILDAGASLYVYASPVYGAFQIALARYCQSLGKQAVIFCAKRQTPHANSLAAKAAGAIVLQVPFGYLSNCQAKAKAYAQAHGGQYLTFGANYPDAISAIASRMRQVSHTLGQEPDEVFCAVGSGTLLKGILQGTDSSRVVGVQVGAAYQGPLPQRAQLMRYPKPFEAHARVVAPFPSCSNYDLKAWEYCLTYKRGKRVLFWNVF